MDREEALASLLSEHSERRLDAARTLHRLARLEDEDHLRAALSNETVAWVRRALVIALTSIRGSLTFADHGLDVFEDLPVNDSAYLRGVRETTERLVHELRSALGLVSYWAGKEFPSFDDTRTARHIERLSECLRAIDELGMASTIGGIEEFPLGDFVSEEAESARQELNSDTPFHLAGPTELIARGDPALLRLALRNVIKNAFEASTKTNSPITLTWGKTDREYWIVVLDRGGGLPSNITRLFEFGVSTKDNHAGAGLTTVRQALRALGGSWNLDLTSEGSTRFEIAWPLKEER